MTIRLLVKAGQMAQAETYISLYQSYLERTFVSDRQDSFEDSLKDLFRQAEQNSNVEYETLDRFYDQMTLAQMAFLTGQKKSAFEIWNAIAQAAKEVDSNPAICDIGLSQFEAGALQDGLRYLDVCFAGLEEEQQFVRMGRDLGLLFDDLGYDVFSQAIRPKFRNPAAENAFYESYGARVAIGLWENEPGTEALMEKLFSQTPYLEGKAEIGIDFAYYWLRNGDRETALDWINKTIEAYRTMCPLSDASADKLRSSIYSDPLYRVSNMLLELDELGRARQTIVLRQENTCLKDNTPTPWDKEQLVTILSLEGKEEEAEALRQAYNEDGDPNADQLGWWLPHIGKVETFEIDDWQEFFADPAQERALGINAGKASRAYARRLAEKETLVQEDFDRFVQLTRDVTDADDSLSPLIDNLETPALLRLAPFMSRDDRIEVLYRRVYRLGNPRQGMDRFVRGQGRPVLFNAPADGPKAVFLINQALDLMVPGQTYPQAQKLALMALKVEQFDLMEQLLTYHSGELEDEKVMEAFGHEYVRQGNLDRAFEYFDSVQNTSYPTLQLLVALRICIASMECAQS